MIKNGPLLKCAPILQPKEAVEEMWEYVKAGVFSGSHRITLLLP
ncbi:MAG: hypothetical protein ACLTTZ_08510 [Lachnospiraceae bacterium]